MTKDVTAYQYYNKDPKRLQAAHSDAETKPERSSSDEKKDDDYSKTESSKAHWWNKIMK